MMGGVGRSPAAVNESTLEGRRCHVGTKRHTSASPLGGRSVRISITGFDGMAIRSQVEDDLQRFADVTARKLRRELAERLAPTFLKDYEPAKAVELVARSAFRDQVRAFPATDPTKVLAFNLQLSEAAVGEVLRTTMSPEEILFVASRVVELGVYSITDPSNLGEPTQFLGASKQHGFFFTPPSVSMLMAHEAIGQRTRIHSALDPAGGCGALVGALLILAKRRDVTIERLHAIELDEFTAKLLKKVIDTLIRRLKLECVFTVTVGNSLDLLGDGGALRGSYDCIVMNPPYGRVKFLRSSLTNAETRVSASRVSLADQEAYWTDKTKRDAQTLREHAKALGTGLGTLDYQRLFIGIALNSLSGDGRCAVISPSTWLGDRDGLQIRRRVVVDKLLESVRLYPETSKLFATVNQPTCVACFSHDATRRSIKVSVMAGPDVGRDDEFTVDVDRLTATDPRMLRIPRMSHEHHAICEQLQTYPRLGDTPWLKNARGELDQSLNKELVRSSDTGLRLIRGDHVERYVLRGPEYSDRAGFVESSAFWSVFDGSPKAHDVRRPRIVSRQCSYLHKGRRLSFTVVPAGVVLGNSCNYITVDETAAPARTEDLLQALCVILNSATVEWYFRLFNSNNHVSNYEIDDFPLCVADNVLLDALAKTGRFLHAAYRDVEGGGKAPSRIEDFADALVAYGYGLTEEQIAQLFLALGDPRGDRVAGMVAVLREEGVPLSVLDGEGWYQHSLPSLSPLDREIISHVPPGGNWQNVPEHVPSKRLEQIREMTAERGVVRTTYYGRLLSDQPAYTIATYYNRPGNGTNIHPWTDRTLTHREAARLQSFPDWYLFLGTETSVRKQIGNAVPPLLGYAVAGHLLSILGGGPCVDLFAGAGGLSLGLELAGCEVAAAVEFDEQIALTYRFNRACETSPNSKSKATLLLQSDLSSSAERAQAISDIKAKLGGRPLGAVLGGPPCQGFSHAGWRVKGDTRNHLVVAFLDMVEALSPRLVVLENVEGLLTFDSGRVVAGLQRALTELGYALDPKPWVLYGEEYGVPQMRRRVFLVGARGVPPPGPPPPMFERCRGRRKPKATLALFSPLRPPTTVGQALLGLPYLMEQRFGHAARRDETSTYLRWLKGLLPAASLLAD